jgi:hypothetical protein
VLLRALRASMQHYTRLFIEVACAAPTVVVCRCSPTQKASIVRLLRQHTGCCTAAIGDGGNDVGMIHAAHVGIGVEGREGRQAALAADFSVTQACAASRAVAAARGGFADPPTRMLVLHVARSLRTWPASSCGTGAIATCAQPRSRSSSSTVG